MNIYGTKIKESVTKLDQWLLNTEKLIWEMEQVRNNLKRINDDIDSDRKIEDEYHNKQCLKNFEVLLAMEAVENNVSKHKEEPKKESYFMTGGY